MRSVVSKEFKTARAPFISTAESKLSLPRFVSRSSPLGFVLLAVTISVSSFGTTVYASCRNLASTKHKPVWVESMTPPVGRFVRYGVAPSGTPTDTVSEGVAAGVGRILMDFAREMGVSIQGSFAIESQALSRFVDGAGQTTDTTRVNEAIQLQLDRKVELQGFRVVEIYWEGVCLDGHEAFLVWVLGSIPRSIPLSIDSVPPAITRTDVLWRSAIIPGWGQFHIKRNDWGGVFVSGLVAGIASTATGFGLRQYYVDERSRSFDADVRKELNDRITICDGVGWAGVGLIALTYIANLINAGLIDLPKDYANFHPEIAVVPSSTSGSVFVSLSWPF